MSKHKAKIAMSLEDMHKGDIYVSSELGYPFWRDHSRFGITHLSDNGDGWSLLAAGNPGMFPATRIFKQPR